MEFKIPEPFLVAVKKMIPEIFDLSVNKVEESCFLNLTTFMPSDRILFIVKVKITFTKGEYPKHDLKGYTNLLNEHFKYVYGTMDFISLRADEFVIPEVQTEREKFYELFGVS